MNQEKPQSKSIRPLRILVAEDNLVNQKVIRILLEKAGLNFQIVNDGVEAVSQFEKEKFDLVLMDCQMPNLDGLHASQQIRNLEAKANTSRCAIVAMTANAMKGDMEKCFEAGMDGFLSKPFRSQDLLHVIDEWGVKND